MRRIIELSKLAAQRINARIAIIAVVALAGGLAVWQGFAQLGSSKAPKGPTKQIATGVQQPSAASGPVQPASASLSDDQLAGSSYAYQTNTDSSSSAYQPPAYSQYGQYGAVTQPPAALPVDPTANQPAPQSVPENPYRDSASAAAAPPSYAPLAQSPYVAAENSRDGYPATTSEQSPAASPATELTPAG